MIGYLKGVTKFVNSDWLILEVNGVGYKVHTDTTGMVPDSPRELFIYTHITQDNWQLWGVPSSIQLKLFELLLSVSGVGPRSAANLIFSLGVDKVANAIEAKQPTLLKVSGVGPKTAEKIVIELRDKVGGIASSSGGSGADMAQYTMQQDLESALVNLGYSTLEARQMVQGMELTADSDLGTLIKQALQKR